MQKILLRTEDGAPSVKVIANPILEETVGIHFSIGQKLKEAAANIKAGLFTATHIATGQSIIGGVPKELAIQAGKAFVEVLPAKLRQSQDVTAVCDALPDGFGTWLKELEGGHIRDWEPVAVDK